MQKIRPETIRVSFCFVVARLNLRETVVDGRNMAWWWRHTTGGGCFPWEVVRRFKNRQTPKVSTLCTFKSQTFILAGKFGKLTEISSYATAETPSESWLWGLGSFGFGATKEQPRTLDQGLSAYLSCLSQLCAHAKKKEPKLDFPYKWVLDDDVMVTSTFWEKSENFQDKKWLGGRIFDQVGVFERRTLDESPETTARNFELYFGLGQLHQKIKVYRTKNFPKIDI